jgi:phytoene dehydrogenase-like protein
MNRNSEKKIVIIGAGVAGLSAGIYARKLGYQAEIYEKNAVPGGECTGWDRNGYHIDNCIHWLIGTTKGSDLNDLYHETRILDDKIGVTRADIMYTSKIGDKSISLYGDLEKFRQELLAISPEDKEPIEKLIAMTKLGEDITIPAGHPGEQMGAIEGTTLLFKCRHLFKLQGMCKGMDNKDLADQFHSPLIKAMLSDFCPKESGASSFPMSYGNFVSGDGGVPKGGSRAVAYRMKARFEELGGIYHGNSPVSTILISGDKATGIKLEDGTALSADYIIPACDAGFTFTHLLDKSYMDPMMRDYFEKPDVFPIYGMFQAAWAVDSPVDALKHGVNLDFPEYHDDEGKMNDRITLNTYGYEPTFAPEGKQIIQVLWGMNNNWEYWEELGKDKEAYRRKKQEMADAVQKKIERTWPEYKGKLTLLDTWTPCTYDRYCNAWRGYNQACIISKHCTKRIPYPSAYIKGLKNVVLAGQWVSPPGGIPGSAITGKFAAYRIDYLEHKKRRICKKILLQNVLPTALVILLILLL